MVRQKLGMTLENKVVQKLKLENNGFNKKWSPKWTFLNDFYFFLNLSIFDIKNKLSKYDFANFQRQI